VLAAAPVNPLVQWMPVFMAAAVVAMAVLITMSVRARISRRQSSRPDPRQVLEKLRSTASRGDNVHAVTARAVDTVQQVAAQLDNKAERLEQLLVEATEKIEALEARLRAAADATAAPLPPPSIAPPVEEPPSPLESPKPAEPADPLTRSVYELADSGNDPLQIAQRLEEQVGKVELILALREEEGRDWGERPSD
jgi:hypothetical protein